jgi:hypothetical protein
MRYIYTLDQGVVATILSSKGKTRIELLRIFEKLAEEPYTDGDWVEQSAAGRPVQVKQFKNWLVTYWPDHFVKQLRIADLRRLEE